ncbi:putative Malectin/receptor-like protein kinase family protein [Tripterygium wilfordii]|uniref:Putative Malectin/receptor-like protein kinase family protein n=1 Tax=Tripterygium wilfordii TaxID=458696 RepID=A0A7J7DRB5_TRIWF|nr:receptor-like protein kinase FERONIA [Tripterygium wilfordii]KAF5748918.1 putative Malectin/receptor-like protein kinase family protein [Tripterygium wilfordii]
MNSNPLILMITLCFFFLLHHHIITPVSGDYLPVENIALDCGSFTNNNFGRLWIGEWNVNISFSEQQHDSSRTSSPTRPLTQIPSVPYSTARISRSKFTYTFRVIPGPKFVRLYFSPTNYDPDFNRSTGFFSVQAGRFTLLNNFSAALNADSLGLQGFAREFCLFVEDERNLSITFTPSPDISDSYAFINGIEVVSMPDYLYYSAENGTGFKFLGLENPYRIKDDEALELMYRINVGGNDISPSDDTGLYRTWSGDDEYLTDARPSALPVNASINLSFEKIPSYAAPEAVYKTARTMGLNKTTNQNYSITWEFIVDSAFIYLVRLHFCEFQIDVTHVGDRVFEIFIANQTAETQADVIAWTNDGSSTRNGIPIYRDYAVMIGNKGNEKKQNLSIEMHPTPEWRTTYSDSLLNGIEIFKISSNANLAGTNPDPVLKIQPDVVLPNPKPKNKRVTVIAIAAGVIAGMVVFAAVAFLIFRRRRLKVKGSGFSDGDSGWAPLPLSSTMTKSTKTCDSPLPSDLCRHFSLSEIKAATNNFDNVFIIGVGGFGNVYKGFINGGATPVAIKRLDPGSQQGAHEFKNEIEMLSQLRHLHLVSLIGYCVENQEMILVYDYMPRGTLRDHLYNTDNPPLPWNQRLEICIGAARGLHYLHTGAKDKIIHRDVKTTNILLDDKWVAKVSDFGLSKLGPTDASDSHVSTVVKGTFGYLDPEYIRRQQLTEKSDVYSFGVVLLEVLFARPAVQKGKVEKNQVSLAVWAQECFQKRTLDQNIDPYLKAAIAPDCLRKFSEVAVSCLLRDGIERPSMSDVVWGLEFALQLQEGAKEAINLSGAHSVHRQGPTKESSMEEDEINSNDIFSSDGILGFDSKTSGVTTTSSDDRHSSLSDNSERMTSGAVFSELVHPEAR